MPSRRTAAEPVFGRTVLISGAESLLAERAVAQLLARAREEAAGLEGSGAAGTGLDSAAVEVAEVEASRLDGSRLAEITGASLFAARRVAVLTDLATLPTELVDPVVALAAASVDDLLLVLVHGGGVKGKGLIDRLRKAKVDVVEAAPLKAYELPQFVTAEVRRSGGSLENSSVAPLLVDAVGHDLRTLAAAVSQLVSDADDGRITTEQIRTYFGGRAEVSSFAVADAVLAGRTGAAMEQLRWATSTGVAPVLITSALAAGVRGLGRLVTAPSGLGDNDLAREVGVPPWKLKSMRMLARGWDQRGLADALRLVATADAAVKGAADDAGFALEQMVIAVGRARRR